MLSEETLNYLKNRRKLGATKSLFIGNHEFSHENTQVQNHYNDYQAKNFENYSRTETSTHSKVNSKNESSESCCNHRQSLKKAVECIESLQIKINELSEENAVILSLNQNLKNYIKKAIGDENFKGTPPPNPLREKNVFQKSEVRLSNYNTPAKTLTPEKTSPDFHVHSKYEQFQRTSFEAFKEMNEIRKSSSPSEILVRAKQKGLEVSPSFSNISKDVYVIEGGNVLRTNGNSMGRRESEENYKRGRSMTEVSTKSENNLT